MSGFKMIAATNPTTVLSQKVETTRKEGGNRWKKIEPFKVDSHAYLSPRIPFEEPHT